MYLLTSHSFLERRTLWYTTPLWQQTEAEEEFEEMCIDASKVSDDDDPETPPITWIPHRSWLSMLGEMIETIFEADHSTMKKGMKQILPLQPPCCAPKSEKVQFDSLSKLHIRL